MEAINLRVLFYLLSMLFLFGDEFLMMSIGVCYLCGESLSLYQAFLIINEIPLCIGRRIQEGWPNMAGQGYRVEKYDM